MRVSEWILAAYFTYVSALSLIRPVPGDIRVRTLAVNGALVYVHRKSGSAEVLLVTYLLGLFLSYAQFPYWPSEPPWIVFPGEDGPAVNTILRRFNGWILGGYGIHTSVFPSAHVSGALAAA